MALVQISAVRAQVRWDRREHRPAEVRSPGHRLRIAGLDAVRDERAAHPIGAGPRMTFLLRTHDGGRVSLVLDSRRRRWFLQAVEPA